MAVEAKIASIEEMNIELCAPLACSIACTYKLSLLRTLLCRNEIVVNPLGHYEANIRQKAVRISSR